MNSDMMIKLFHLLVIVVVSTNLLVAQNVAEKEQSIAQGLGLFIFPSGGQDKETQDLDEYDCYKWAMQQTGYNPLNPPEIEAEEVEQGPDGGAVVGAAGGAAAGAAIGAIAGDAGKGAAIGATVGAIRGRRVSQYNKAKEQEQNNQAAAQESEKLLNDFKKAFTACMTGKNYSIQ
jgi:hypothetical protein